MYKTARERKEQNFYLEKIILKFLFKKLPQGDDRNGRANEDNSWIPSFLITCLVIHPSETCLLKSSIRPSAYK